MPRIIFHKFSIDECFIDIIPRPNVLLGFRVGEILRLHALLIQRIMDYFILIINNQRITNNTTKIAASPETAKQKMLKDVKIYEFFPGFRIINTTAATQMAMPNAILSVMDSPNRSVPIRMAVSGSKTPRTDVFVGPM